MRVDIVGSYMSPKTGTGGGGRAENLRRYYEELWEQRFAELEAFIRAHGHSYVPSTRGECHETLGRWCETQRRYFRIGRLSQTRAQRLDAIGFDWAPIESAWMDMLERCRAFKFRHGHLAIPSEWEEDLELASWATEKRKRYWSGELEARRIALLEKLGFVWSLQEDTWQQHFVEYAELYRKHGAKLDQSHMSKQLVSWTSHLRLHPEHLSQEQLTLLRAVGFSFDPQKDRWERQFQALKRYKHQFGDTLVPYQWSDDPSLAAWVQSQRYFKARGVLPLDRERRLNRIGFVWTVNETAWDRQYKKLVQYKQRHGHARVPTADPALGSWVKQQRAVYHAGRMTPDRLRRLKAVGFEFSILS